MSEFKNGKEYVDPTPINVPIHLKRPDTLAEQVRRLVRGEISRQAQAEGHETFEEADDFDTGEDEDIRSPYELDDEQTNAKFVEERPDERKRIIKDKAQIAEKSSNAAGPSRKDKADARNKRKSDNKRADAELDEESSGDED